MLFYDNNSSFLFCFIEDYGPLDMTTAFQFFILNFPLSIVNQPS